MLFLLSAACATVGVVHAVRFTAADVYDDNVRLRKLQVRTALVFILSVSKHSPHLQQCLCNCEGRVMMETQVLSRDAVTILCLLDNPPVACCCAMPFVVV